MRRSRWGYLITRTPAGTTAMLGYGLGALVPPAPASPSGKFLDSTGVFSVPAGGGVTYGDVVTETSYGQASTAGTSTHVSRADHTHGTPSLSTATPSALGVAAAGTALYPSKGDHVHAMPSAADVGAISLVLTTTKGDMIVDDGADPARLAAGSPGRTLYAKPAATVGLAWGIPAWMQPMYSTGADGVLAFDGAAAVTIDGVSHSPSGGVYTLTRDVHATTITLSGSAVIATAGYRVRCHKLIGDAGHTIRCVGASASGGTAGVGYTSGSTTLQIFNSSGGNGRSTVGAGANGVNLAAPAVGAAGGSGGSSGAGQAGGTGGTAGALTAIHGRITSSTYMLTGWLDATAGIGATIAKAGAGGGAGGCDGGGGTSGGGGAGGGRCHIYALECDFAGTISADGGTGGDATAGAGNLGGGGGGGGGEAVLYTEVLTRTPTVSAAGGVGGAGRNLGSAGSAGSTGRAVTVSPGA